MFRLLVFLGLALAALLAAGPAIISAAGPADTGDQSRHYRAIEAIIFDEAQSAGPGIDPAEMARTAWCESRYNINAIGRRGEIGLWQIMPAELGGIGRTFLFWGYRNPRDPRESTRFAVQAFGAGMAHHWSCWKEVRR